MTEQENSKPEGVSAELQADTGMARRHWITAGVAAFAGVAGALVAWQKYQPQGVLDVAVQNFWNQSFEKPEGGTLEMSAFRGKPLLVNFWATWCPPCIEELPLIDAFYKANQDKSFQVVGLAVDQPSQVRRFLTQKPLQFPNGLAGMVGTELGVSLGNAQSALPYSVLFDAKGRLLAQKAGKLDQKDLDSWLKKVS
jgi:thiol-disulfide isomerase/thioredoxin